MNNAVEKLKTIYDIEALPDDERVELVDGVIYDMAGTTRDHQDIVGGFYRKIMDHIDQNKGKCRAYMGPYAVCSTNDIHNYLEPDVYVVCDRSKLEQKSCQVVPDWVIEVVSPTSRDRDYVQKLFSYKTAGVREYWIVDPITEKVVVYNLEEGGIQTYSFSDDIDCFVMHGLSLKVENFLLKE